MPQKKVMQKEKKDSGPTTTTFSFLFLFVWVFLINYYYYYNSFKHMTKNCPIETNVGWVY